MTNRQTKYTIAEGVTLPSMGAIYPGGLNPNVELRSMTARDEMKRLSPSTTPYKTMSEIIEGCLIEKLPVKVYDLALPDYEFLLHKLRIVTYGDEFKMGTICEHCGQFIDAIAHLEELEIVPLDIEHFNALQKVHLPASDKIVTLRYLTPRLVDEQDARVKELQRKYKDTSMDYSVLVSAAGSVDEVDGLKVDFAKAEKFVEGLPARDLLILYQAINKFNISFGIDSTIMVDCPSCGELTTTFFRFGPEFFRPSNL